MTIGSLSSNYRKDSSSIFHHPNKIKNFRAVFLGEALAYIDIYIYIYKYIYIYHKLDMLFSWLFFQKSPVFLRGLKAGMGNNMPGKGFTGCSLKSLGTTGADSVGPLVAGPKGDEMSSKFPKQSSRFTNERVWIIALYGSLFSYWYIFICL